MAFNPITVNKGPSANPHIYAEDDAAIFQSMFGEDGILDIGSKLELSIQSNNLVRMSDGALCVGGHIGRIKYADYVDLTIDNGETGHNRNDLIIGSFRNTGEHTIDTFEPQVVKGTPATGDAVDPTLTEGSLYEGEYLRQVAVARVKLEGLNIVGIDMLLPVIPSIPSLKEQLDELNRNLPQGIPLSAEQSGVLALESARLKIIYGTYPLNAFISHQESGGYAKEFDISKYGLKDPVWGTASARYPNGHPHVFIGVVNANKLILLSDANVSDGYAHWMVIGNY